MMHYHFVIAFLQSQTSTTTPTEGGTASSQFFTLISFASLASASTIVFVVSNGLQRAFNFNPRWLGLALSVLVGCIGVYVAPTLTVPDGPPPGGVDYLMGVLNGFLIFATASGATSVAGNANGVGNPRASLGAPAGAPAPGGGPPGAAAMIQSPARPRRAFLEPWF